MKPVDFIGSSRDDLRSFPAEVRRLAGEALMVVQLGDDPSDWKPMTQVGMGARELRIQHMGQWRIIYVAKFKNVVYVLHCFHKKTQKTSRQDIEIARKRYRQIGGPQ